MLHRADGPIDGELVRETLILNLPGEDYEKGFATFIDWALYGDLFAYDGATGKISLPADGHQPSDNGRSEVISADHKV